MPVSLIELAPGVLELKAKGKLTDRDYRDFVPRLEEVIKRFGKVSVLFHLEGFRGWTIRAAWDDLQLGLKHYRDFERMAMVGDPQWLALFMKPFLRGRVRAFGASQVAEATAWLMTERRAA